MKPALLALIILLLLAGSVDASVRVRLAWDPNQDAVVRGYVVHYGPESRDYSQRLDVGNQTSATLSNLTGGVTYYIAVTAYNEEQVESDFSNEIDYTPPAPEPPPPPPPVGPIRFEPGAGPGLSPRLHFSVLPGEQYEMQASEDMCVWRTIRVGISPLDGMLQVVDRDASLFPQRFYRVVQVPRTLPGALTLVNAASSEVPALLAWSVLPGQYFRLLASSDLRHWVTVHEGVSTTQAWVWFADTDSVHHPPRSYQLGFP